MSAVSEIHLVRDQLHSVYLKVLEKKQDDIMTPQGPLLINMAIQIEHAVLQTAQWYGHLVVDKEILLKNYAVLWQYLFVWV